MSISVSERELGQAWIEFWQQLKSNNSAQYIEFAHLSLFRISKSTMNNPEIWMLRYLAYLDEIAAGVDYQVLGNLIDLPEKPLSPFWQRKWDELGWQTIQSYGGILFSAAGKKSK